MATMNQNQQRYAMKRVEEIRKQRELQLKEKWTRTNKVTDKDKLKALEKGRFDWSIPYDVELSTPIEKCVSFDDDLYETPVLDEENFKKDLEALRKEAGKVTDEIMLGDAEKAIKLLQAFEC